MQLTITMITLINGPCHGKIVAIRYPSDETEPMFYNEPTADGSRQCYKQDILGVYHYVGYQDRTGFHPVT